MLERRLLWAWSTPIVNDFFVMIFFGLLRSRCEALLPDAPGLANRLLAGDGDLPSTQPARRGVAVARQSSAGRFQVSRMMGSDAVYRAKPTRNSEA